MSTWPAEAVGAQVRVMSWEGCYWHMNIALMAQMPREIQLENSCSAEEQSQYESDGL